MRIDFINIKRARSCVFCRTSLLIQVLTVVALVAFVQLLGGQNDLHPNPTETVETKNMTNKEDGGSKQSLVFWMADYHIGWVLD